MTIQRLQFRHETASCVLVVVDGIGRVSSVHAKVRHAGHATGLLKSVIDFADKNDLELYLEAKPYGHPIHTILQLNELVEFYKQFGFEPDDVETFFPTMRRPRR